jgi:DNA-binding transcriptional ArsR family regulator
LNNMPARLPSAKLTESALELIATRFKALSEPVRLKLIIALEDGEKSVSDLVEASGKSQANVSRHLKQLEDVGILSRRREGTHIYYSIADPAIFVLCDQVCGSLYRQFVEKGKVTSALKR